MNILIIGAGSRESAIGWSLYKSPHKPNLYFSPGNSGTVQYGENLPINIEKLEELVLLSKEKKIDLVIVGPFSYIKKGAGELFREAGIAVFSPTLEASEIENSKVFSKKLLNDLNIPTAKSFIAYSMDLAQDFLKTSTYPLVMKTDSPVPGIGVEIINNYEQANYFLENCFSEKIFGLAGKVVVIEEFLEGIEISAHAFCDGKTAVMMPFSQDHKKLFDNDKGPNTSGIGAVAPILNTNKELLNDIKNKVIEPILMAMSKQGRPFVGVMYPGIMITKEGWKVLEINARFGDPEAVCYMRLLQTDLYDIISACILGNLESTSIKWLDKYTCSIVLTTDDYSGKTFKAGQQIQGLTNIKEEDSTIIFHGETSLENDYPITVGSRVACISSVEPTLKQAVESAYKKINDVTYNGKHYRNDIGTKALSL